MTESGEARLGTEDRLAFYRRLERMPLVRGSYARKFVYAAFIGAQLPLMVFILFLLISDPDTHSIRSLILALGLACFAGFLGTVSLVREILVPIQLTDEALRAFLDARKLPDLPTVHRDAAGRLMEGTQYTLVQLDKNIRRLEGVSTTDALTGIYNRRAAEQRLAEEVSRAERNREEFEFAFIDMNRFKAINDTLGHAAGDAAIRHVAEHLKASVRAGDWVARWGGDEFVVALHRNTSHGRTYDRIVEAVTGSPCVVENGREVKLALSVGVAKYRMGMGLEAFVADADRAMYAAKNLSQRDGGSSVVYATVPGEDAKAAAA